MKNIIIGLLALGSISASASEFYQLSTVDSVEVLKNKNFKITYTLPCKDLDFETFTAASDDSGNLEIRVGVVYKCIKGKAKTFERIVTPHWSEYKLLESGLDGRTDFIPMKVRKYGKSKD